MTKVSSSSAILLAFGEAHISARALTKTVNTDISESYDCFSYNPSCK